jgi:haloacetate dehalogenase
MDAELALGAFHWPFLAQPDGLPEALLDGHERHFVREVLRRWAIRPGVFEPDAVDEYVGRFRAHETCEDYRAGATVDRLHDEQDARAGRRIAAPLPVLWGASFNAQAGDRSRVWRRWADQVSGRGFSCGHFLPEEEPDAVRDELLAFLARHADAPP